MRRILVSFSGGESSAMMAYLMKNKYGSDSNVELAFVFANTGEEREETLVFVDQCDKAFGLNLVWVESIVNPEFGKGVRHKVVDFQCADRQGAPFEAVIRKYGIPNSQSPHCSKFLKGRVIESYLKSIGWNKYEKALGIRLDEPKRLNWKDVKRQRILYPLAIEFPSTKHDVWRFWEKMPFRLNLKTYEGNCRVCWKKSKRKLLTIAVENPKAFDFFNEMEIRYSDFVPETKNGVRKAKPPIRFFRDNLSVSDILEEAEFDFDMAIDEKILPRSLPLWSDDMDSNFGCVESCEAF